MSMILVALIIMFGVRGEAPVIAGIRRVGDDWVGDACVSGSDVVLTLITISTSPPQQQTPEISESGTVSRFPYRNYLHASGTGCPIVSPRMLPQ